MENNPLLTSIYAATNLSKQCGFDGYENQKIYPNTEIKSISEYVMSMRTDKRAVATGVDATNYAPFQTLTAGSDNHKVFARSVGLYVNMISHLVKPSSVLVDQSVSNPDVIVMMHRMFSSKITILNGPYLHLYEKFIKHISDSINEIPYFSRSKYEIINDQTEKYDLVILYSDDLEGEYDYTEAVLNSLSDSGTLLIVNSANQGMLYHSADYTMTPQAELHEFINSNTGFATYHIPNLIGFTVVKKIS
jgi:hypothetical protein